MVTCGWHQFGAFAGRHWVTVTSLLTGLALGVVVGYGFAQRWGAAQWGPFAEWFAGVATFSAVVVALREAARGQRARRVDHEFARRRECLKAVSDVWGALSQVGMDFNAFKSFLDDLPPMFNANLPRKGGPGQPLAEEIFNRIETFFTTWVQRVEPPLFAARALLQGTPLDAEVQKISADIKKIQNEILPEITKVVVSEQGRRPDTESFRATYQDIMKRRQDHLDLALKHYSLAYDDVEAAALHLKSTRAGRVGV